IEAAHDGACTVTAGVDGESVAGDQVPIAEDALPGVPPPRVAYAHTRAFRADYRAHAKISDTRMALHIAITNAGVAASFVFLARGLHDVSVFAWLTVPLTFLYANLIEYVVHRYMMHNRRRLFFFAFKRHTLDHHSFYTDRAMAWDRFTDSRLIFFPTILQLS